MAVKRQGAWSGIKPRKQPNGRLLWPRDAVFRAAGLVADGDSAAVDLRPWLAFLEANGLPGDDAALRGAGVRMLSHCGDKGRDAAYLLDEGALVSDVVMAYGDRLDGSLKRMGPADRRRALMTLRFIAETCSAFLDADELKVTR
jgi:hypothetical protein